jgi:translation initiation factor IF-2
MTEQSQRLSKVAKEFDVGVDTILEFLVSKGVDDLNRNSKISPENYEVLVDEYQPDKKVKADAKELKKAEVELKSQEKEEAQTLHSFKVKSSNFYSNHPRPY